MLVVAASCGRRFVTRGNKKQRTATLDITQRLEDGSQKWVLANGLEAMRLALQIQ
jgi:hypothetical protein